jgi:hypothetical protein
VSARACGWLALAALLALTAPSLARAQDDGPRVYQLAPVGAKTLTGFAVVKQSNETFQDEEVVSGSQFASNVVVLRYAETFDLWGRQLNPFVILPTGEVRQTVAGPGGVAGEASSGLGDAQIGAVFGLLGSPALTPDAYPAYRPFVTSGLLARVFFPTGAYSQAKTVNLGANRFAYQLGAPTTFMFGQSYTSRTLTALEVLPTVTFYEANDAPHGATRVTRAPLFSMEAHLTRTIGSAFWVSADMLYRSGGATTTDGAPDDNPTRGWSAGISGALRIRGQASVILTYEHVISRSDNGPDGWFFRTALVVPFR